jgi:hypothetical protein
MKAITETTKLNFITDQGSTRATVRWACRLFRRCFFFGGLAADHGEAGAGRWGAVAGPVAPDAGGTVEGAETTPALAAALAVAARNALNAPTGRAGEPPLEAAAGEDAGRAGAGVVTGSAGFDELGDADVLSTDAVSAGASESLGTGETAGSSESVWAGLADGAGAAEADEVVGAPGAVDALGTRLVNQLLVAATACLTTCPGLVPSVFPCSVDTRESAAESSPLPLAALGGGAIVPVTGTADSGGSSPESSRSRLAIVRGVSGARPASPTPILLVRFGVLHLSRGYLVSVHTFAPRCAIYL